MNGNLLIEEYLDKKTFTTLDTLLNEEKEDAFNKAAVQLSSLFNSEKAFENILKDEEAEKKLVASFQNNLLLLIQKTWVEKSDEVLKAEVLTQLEEFCSKLSAKKYTEIYQSFFEILNKVVYLMFGSQTKNKDFEDYALRIDPEFGIFWWYIKSLPEKTSWTDLKNRTIILLGMYFLANY